MANTLRTRRLPYDAGAARKHLLRADTVMRDLVQSVGPFEMRLRGRPYQSLMRALLYQQLAGAAAATIERRLLAIFGGRVPEPDELLATKAEQLRAAGLSRQKASYLYSLAEHFADGSLSDRRLYHMADEEAIAAVTQVKGVGRWTADMLLMFCLGRPDVLPVGDYGVRKSMQLAYALEDLPTPGAMEEIAEPWRPYRSAGAWYLWRRADTLTL
jgi:3-methyladenine DNA glycosylase/8-oxoguanine DNA glycosylase